jgi:hypothetical protein
MKHFILSIFFMAALLSACATTQHFVNQEKLSSVKDQLFHLRSVTIPCDGIQFSSQPFQGCFKDCQLAVLNSIPTEEIMKDLSRFYGLKTANDKLEIESEVTNLLAAAVTDSAGRCFSMRSNTSNANSIDIEYTISPTTIPAKITTGYEITVLTSKNVLIKHKGEIDSFWCPSMGSCFKESIEYIKATAHKIPSTLEHDIAADAPTKKP